MTTPKTRTTAKMLGINKFQTGRPCARGHYTYRYTNSGACAECCLYYARSRNGNTAKRYVFSDYLFYKEDVEFIKSLIREINHSRTFSGKRPNIITLEDF